MSLAVSLVCTVKNEADNIAALLDSMLAQSRRPDEIVVNDCGSTDATATIVGGYIERGAPIRLVAGGFNIASGRNNAIRHANGPIIASTDAGLTLDSHWLERIIAPIERDEADLVGGFYVPDPHTPFEVALGATNFRDADEIDPQHFLAAGQSVAFRKTVWASVGGYPEWLDHSEDLVFDRAVAAAGYRVAAALDACIFFRPRESLWAFARQYFFYARGDGVANLWSRRHAMRYAVYTLLVATLTQARQRPWLLGWIPLWLAVYTRQPYQRLRRRWTQLSTGQKLRIIGLPPLIRIVGDGAKMIGYAVGVARRLSTGRSGRR